MGWVARVRNLGRRGKVDAEIEEELRAHVEMAVEDGVSAGLSEAEARRRARVRFGNPVTMRERTMGADAALGVESLWRDVRFALRQMKKSPGFAVTAVLTLALGIGATTAIFSLVESFVLRPLPYPHSDRLVVVWEQLRALGIRRFPAPLGDFVDYRNDNRVFDAMAAVENAHFVLSGSEYPERIYAVRATASLFPMMGLRASLGRVLTAEDNEPGHEHVAVLSDGLWRERFGGDPAVVGRNVVLDGEDYEVVGVLARGERFSVGYPRTPQLWTPLAMVADPERRMGQLEMVARLRPGVAVSTAQAQMSALAAQLERQYHIEMGPHGEDPGYGVQVTPLHEELTGNLHEPLLLMLGATVAVFLIVCANLASLMLTHGLCRERELAIRIALGAGRGRLMRLLMLESAVIALAGAATGAGIAAAASELLVRLSPYEMAALLGRSMDARVLGFAVSMGMAAMALFGLAPALTIAGRVRVLPGPQMLSAWPGQTMRRGLVVGEMAMAAALTIGAGMLIHSFVRVQEVPLGFEAQGLLTAEVNLPPAYGSGTRQKEFYEELLQRMEAEPGVEAVATTTMLPAAERPLHDPFSVEGQPWRSFGAGRVPQFMNHQAVSTAYFRTMGMTLREGRLFTAEDRGGGQLVAIVNETMVRGFWPGENAIGKRLMPGASAATSPPWLTVVGVVADVRSGGATAETQPELYTPMAQTPAANMAVLVRTKTSDVEQSTAELRDSVRAIDRGVPLEGVATYDELLAGQVAPRRYEMLLLAAFGGLALLLAGVGLYGVVSYTVTQRTREIGLRIALGAAGWTVVAMILRQALWLAVCGIATGIALAAIFRHLLASAVFGIALIDVPVNGGVAVLLLGVAAMAAAIPARRAASVDPMQALRSE